ncbi:Geranylgeranyl pyrophosphate synthase [Wickerhamiella sorbophila]|uniref:Geranylgeranyl pyrophosphate synthase n=1 Tax=Wickerhamiella sorbophila TaxID=45607 RepID=A0A2T0FIL3_9ASCO|nr:Geranylgeranyl pyrophosphate synthase [Wickerhamiella sorbophila]PRT54841.1 Geranylgeranyl pyrophosphate synthase [Wickerhamiella sorbophila]
MPGPPDAVNGMEDVVTAPFKYLEKAPGKDLRSLLINEFNKALEVPPEPLEVITRIIKTLHTASLLVDDVEDSATLRRGLPVAHAIYGIPQTINASNYMLFVGLQDALTLGIDAVAIFTEEIKNLHMGQGMDLYWRDNYHCPSLEEYIQMVLNKTGGLYRMAVRLMQSQSSESIDLVPLANDLGVLYQIQDDFLNLQSAKYTTNKGFCEDLTEGKFSLPIIHSIRSDETNSELLNILRQRTTSMSLKRHALEYMESTNSFEYTRQLMKQYESQARDHINELNLTFLHDLIDKLVLV